MRTIKTISEFKKMATLTHDNKKIASANWAKSWGLGWWFDLWYYKEYCLNSLKYRSGYVILRHHSESVKKYYLGDKEISKKEFFELANTIEYRPIENTVCVKTDQTKKPMATQLTLF